jgi:hypothetical protein
VISQAVLLKRKKKVLRPRPGAAPPATEDLNDPVQVNNKKAPKKIFCLDYF